jgi:hypothetical protein
VNPSLGSEQFSNNTVVIFPNPAQEQLTIQLLATTTIKQIRLMDLLGRVLKTVNYSSAKKEEVLDLREIANGNYLLQVVSSNNQSEIKQIIVN